MNECQPLTALDRAPGDRVQRPGPQLGATASFSHLVSRPSRRRWHGGPRSSCGPHQGCPCAPGPSRGGRPVGPAARTRSVRASSAGSRCSPSPSGHDLVAPLLGGEHQERAAEYLCQESRGSRTHALDEDLRFVVVLSIFASPGSGHMAPREEAMFGSCEWTTMPVSCTWSRLESPERLAELARQRTQPERDLWTDHRGLAPPLVARSDRVRGPRWWRWWPWM